MASKKQLLSITYHFDTDTGMYEMGEIDFSVSEEFDKHIKKYGRKGLNDILLTLSHLIWHCKEYGDKIIKSGDSNS